MKYYTFLYKILSLAPIVNLYGFTEQCEKCCNVLIPYCESQSVRTVNQQKKCCLKKFLDY